MNNNTMQLRMTGLELGKARAAMVMLAEFAPSRELKVALDKVEEAIAEAEKAVELAMFREDM